MSLNYTIREPQPVQGAGKSLPNMGVGGDLLFAAHFLPFPNPCSSDRKHLSMQPKKIRVKGSSEKCPRCRSIMQRREHTTIPQNKPYYFSEWDYCINCGYLQHYEKFKVFLNRPLEIVRE